MITVNSDYAGSVGRIAVVVAFCVGGLFTVVAKGQTAAANQPATVTTNTSPEPVRKSGVPAMTEFRKVAIGLPAEKVKEFWGKAKVEDKDGFLYDLSDSETAQVRLGPDQKVTTIAVTFAGGKGAPTLVDVFGEGATAESSQGGTVYKMVRYPDAGYWVSYFASSGDNRVTTLTIQKL